MQRISTLSYAGLLLLFVVSDALGAGAAGNLQVGFGESDITPPVGTSMTGAGLVPSVGVDDPLMARALVARSGDRTLAIVSVDLVKVQRNLSDAAIADASRRTGIDPDAILICATHNHSSPFIPKGGPKNKEYLATLPGRIADSIERAYKALQPARMHIGRTLVFGGLHNRRVVSKATGTVINTWLPKKQNDLRQTPQILGTEGPIDPEMWAVRFNARNGRVLGVLVNFTCVPNMHDRIRLKTFSADYPGVIAERMKRAFGKRVVTVFTLGAAGNVNPNKPFSRDWRTEAEVFARAAVGAAGGITSIPVKGPIEIGFVRRNVRVPRRDASDQRPGAVARLGWRPEQFAKQAAMLARMPRTLELPVSALRIGPLGIVTNPGELFVEWGLSIKKRSPFRYTIICEMTNDWQAGYEPTAIGFEHEGYEALPGVNFVPLNGIRTLVDTAVELLQELHGADGR